MVGRMMGVSDNLVKNRFCTFKVQAVNKSKPIEVSTDYRPFILSLPELFGS